MQKDVISHVGVLTAGTHNTPGGSVRLHYSSATSADYVNIPLGGEQPPHTELRFLTHLFIPSVL